MKEDGGDEVIHFACHIGHRISVETLLTGPTPAVERALWSAVRALREQAALSEKLAQRSRVRPEHTERAERYERQAKRSREEAEELMSVLNRREVINDIGGHNSGFIEYERH